MKTTITYAFGVVAMVTVITFTSCKKDQAATAAALGADATKAVAYYDSTVTFTSFKTIAIADSVHVINGSTVTTELTATEVQYRQAMIDSLTARGFTIVTKTSSPDLALNLTRIGSTSSGMLDNAGFWSNYASFYDPTVYGETGLTYTVNMTTSQSVGDGLLSFELLDLKDVPSKNTISVVWEGSVSGSSLINNASAANAETGFLLADAPYLKTN